MLPQPLQSYITEVILVVAYFPALKLFKIRSLEEVLRILQDFCNNSSGILEEFFKNLQGEEIDHYHYIQ